MRLLLIHQNFPGQFRHLAAVLAARGHDVVALGRRDQAPRIPGVTYGAYSVIEPEDPSLFSDVHLEMDLRRAERVRAACLQLRESGWIADTVLFHSSWGEGLYLRDVWPQQRLLGYPELFGSPGVMGYGFDQDLGDPDADLCAAIRRRNLLGLAAIADCDVPVAPTRHQRDSFPLALRAGFRVIHEGIDVERLAPHPDRWVVLGPDLALKHGDPVVTFCSRHLEPLRGLPTFLRSLVILQRAHRRVQVLIVGDQLKGYGPRSTHPDGHLAAMLAQLGGQLDLDRIHFLGRLDYEHLLGVFQVSAAHVYLTYPYALSWSLLEAMACGAPVVGSAGPPVNEVISSEVNGLLVDFNNPDQLAAALLRLLEDAPLRQRLAAAGRRTVQRHYALERCADAYEMLLRCNDAGLASD
jgi:glycosyltransferase involved in cell wall biosynthesis